MWVAFRAVDTGQFAQSLHQFMRPPHRAGQRAADPDMELSGRRLAEPRIERHHLHHLDRLEIELRGHPLDRCGGNIAEPLLHDVQQRQCRRALVLRVMRDAFVRSGLQLRRDFKRWEKLRSGSFVRGDAFFERGNGHDYLTSFSS